MAVQFEVRRGDQHLGAFSVQDIRIMATSGKLQPSDEIRQVGTQLWVSAGATKGLEFSSVSSTGNASPTSVASPAMTDDSETGLMGVAIFANLIALLVNLLRGLLGRGRIIRNASSARTLGHLLLLIVSVLYLLGSLWVAIKVDSMEIMLLGVGVFIAMGVGQYVADKFIAAGTSLLRSTPTSLNNLVLLDVIGLVAVLIGLAALGAGVVTAIQTDSLLPLILGFFALLIYLLCGSMAYCPEALNITHAKSASAGEEAIGLASFFIKTLLLLAPFFYLIGALASIVVTCMGLYALLDDQWPILGYQRITMAGWIMLAASFYPLILYVIFLVYYLFIDVIRAILNIDSNVENIHKSDG